MPSFSFGTRQVAYEEEGDGFPLLLMPEPRAGLSPWLPYMPLLGELCRTLAYEPQVAVSGEQGASLSETAPMATLTTCIEALHLERFYLVSPLLTWATALRFARQHPAQLEAMVLTDVTETPETSWPSQPPEVSETDLGAITVPTLVLVADGPTPATTIATTLATQLANGSSVMMSLNGNVQRQRGHAMLRFLIHRERQRNLVRGASFLL